mmetsp:Transcript_81425/g.174313  ORF Transcript_81425/g.174313 Transcript_81425/m.174313 type:complete len:255 (-) Transcript_81425:102-866(-)
MRRPISDDVELSQGWAALVESPLTKDEAVTVIVHMREADLVFATAEDTQLSCGSGLQKVRHEEGVARSVDLVRCHSDGQELVTTSVGEQLFTRRLRGRILLEIRRLRQRRQLELSKPIDVTAIEARAWRGRHHDLRDASSTASIHHMLRAHNVHRLIELVGVKGPHSGTHMPYAIRTLHSFGHVLLAPQVALHVNNARVLPSARWLREHVKGHDPLRTSFYEHLHKALPHKAAAPCHNALGWDRRVRALGCPTL